MKWLYKNKEHRVKITAINKIVKGLMHAEGRLFIEPPIKSIAKNFKATDMCGNKFNIVDGCFGSISVEIELTGDETSFMLYY